jgi:hypothetical protein
MWEATIPPSKERFEIQKSSSPFAHREVLGNVVYGGLQVFRLSPI